MSASAKRSSRSSRSDRSGRTNPRALAADSAARTAARSAPQPRIRSRRQDSRPLVAAAFTHPAPAPDGSRRPAAIAPASTAALHQVTTVEHQGTVIAFARERGTGAVYYDVLDLKVSTDVDDAEWTGYSRLAFPVDLRSVGLGIVTVPDRAGRVLAAAGTRIEAVSDDIHVHLFQQSSRGTLLLNRYVFKRSAPEGGGPAAPVLEPAWEVRFQRSGKQDVPGGPKDSQGYTAPDGVPFIEPTLELPMVRGFDDGRFAAQLLPDQSGPARRWQFFAVNGATGTLDTFSFPVDGSGLPDLTGAVLDEAGNAVPDMSLSLALHSGAESERDAEPARAGEENEDDKDTEDGDGPDQDLTLAGAPAAAVFTLLERVRTDGGDDLLLKRTTRDLVVVPVTTPAGERRFATLDFAVGQDGTLARLPARTVATPVNEVNYALDFAPGTYLALPRSGTMKIDGCFRARFWLYPGSELAAGQYVLRGDPAVPAERAAPWVRVTRDLRVEFGFGDGRAAVSSATELPVVKPGQWVEVEVGYDDREARPFSARINGCPVPVTRPAAAGLPQGEPIAYVGAPLDGIAGILDGLRIEQLRDGVWTVAGDWPFNDVDYDPATPVTPDVSGNHNDAQVWGAAQVASSAPIPDAGTEGRLYVDERGRSAYAGVLVFAEPDESGTLLTGADGLVHLYFAGPRSGGQDGLFSVAQYDAQSARAVFEAQWATGPAPESETEAEPGTEAESGTEAATGSARQTGAVTFTAARSGVFMNQATVQVRPAEDAGLCEIEFGDQQGHAETWRGVPRALGTMIAVVNGLSTHDLADPGLAAGNRAFYDNTGRYATVRLTAESHSSPGTPGGAGSADPAPPVVGGCTLLSRRPAALQLAGAAIRDATAGEGLLELRYAVPGWPEPITQAWRRVPLNVAALLPVLAGTSATYDYRETGSADATVYGLPAAGPGGTRNLLLIARAGTGEVRVGIGAGRAQDRCTVTIELGEDGRRIVLPDVPRDQNALADAVNAGDAGSRLRAVTDGLTAAVPDIALGEPRRLDLRAWTGVLAAFPEERLAPDAALPVQNVAASVRQGSTLTVGDRSQVLDGPSTLFRALAGTRPSDGLIAGVQDTGGAAKLAVAAVGGGWTRVAPHKAVELGAAGHITFDTPPPSADALATAGDMTVEAWCRPGAIGHGTDPDRLVRPRLANYYRRGSTDDPDEEIRWTLGLWPGPALNFGDTTEVGCLPEMPPNADCTLQLTFTPAVTGATGNVLGLRTTGIARNYLRVTVDAAQHLAVWWLDGTAPVLTSAAKVAPGRWTQATVTVNTAKRDGTSPVAIALYVDGAADNSVTLPASGAKVTPASLSVGATSAGYRMRANGGYLWKRTLNPQEVAATGAENPHFDDPDLLVAWPMTEGEGGFLTNQAVGAAGQHATIVNADRQGWSKKGAYGVPWAANRFFSIVGHQPVLHGWHHLASSYLSGFALALDGSDYADCGSDSSLDATDSFSVEACFTPANSGNGSDQAVVSKPGNYELRVDAEGALLAQVWTDELDTVEVRSVGGRSDYRVEHDVPCYAVAVVSTGPVKSGSTDGKSGPPSYFLHVELYVDGELRNRYAKDDLDDPVYIQTSTRPLNLGRSALGGANLTGRLSDVRLWNLALSAAAVTATHTRRKPPSTDGLVSGWRWSEGTGKYGYDDTGLNTAVLSANNLWRRYQATSQLVLVVDGVEETEPRYDNEAVDELMYGSQQFTAGAVRKSRATADDFDGALSELRVWNRARTAEQIREDMYRVLAGNETGLAGYWKFDTGSGQVALDATGNGNTGTFAPDTNPPRWISGRAPLSNEAKEVHNVLGGQLTEFTARITGTPSVSEYADTRRDAYGALYSVMKRCYGADRYGSARLASGYTVGDLDTVYAGQVQAEPSVVGFIEGAPPIPSENQTNPYWSDIAFANSYADSSTTRVTHAESVTRAFSAGQADETSIDVGGSAGVYFSTELSGSVGLGEELEWTIASTEGRLGYTTASSIRRGDERELGFGYGRTTTTVDQISSGGEWEDPGQLLNPEVGRRYVPENQGYAVVKSLTADMYLVTLSGSSTVIRTVLVPDPDIPEDVNVITFPIDPGYTKNGTLDGMVGFVTDPDFPYADVQRASYFRPVEAYALKRQLERQDKQLESYYRQFDTEHYSHGRPRLWGDQDTGLDDFGNRALPADPAYDWAKGLSKRAIVNTYVWTSGGGLHSEQTETVDTRSESYSGLSAAQYADGLATDIGLCAPVGLYAEFDATFGSSLEVVSRRSQDSESGFALDVEFETERFLKAPVLDADGQPVGFAAERAPGKVTGYRFLSFLIPQNQANFTAFTTQVIDQNWLHESADPDAAALRTATAQANGVWRVMHRTTYVSRVAPPLQPAPAESTASPVTKPAGLEANTLLVRLIEKQIDAAAPSPAAVGAAVAAVLGTGPADPGLLAKLLPWWQTFVEDAQTARTEAHTALAALRVDLLAYMNQKYAADLAQAGGKAVAALREG